VADLEYRRPLYVQPQWRLYALRWEYSISVRFRMVVSANSSLQWTLSAFAGMAQRSKAERGCAPQLNLAEAAQPRLPQEVGHQSPDCRCLDAAHRRGTPLAERQARVVRGGWRRLSRRRLSPRRKQTITARQSTRLSSTYFPTLGRTMTSNVTRTSVKWTPKQLRPGFRTRTSY
jgi:hypothetical protein